MKVTVQNIGIIIKKYFGLLFWLILIVLCFVFREYITVEGIVNFSPEEPLLAALVLFCCFAIKSLTVFVYGGILYAAGGIMFPLPVAILVNIAGTIIMNAIPFFIGRKKGGAILSQIVHKHPKLALLKEAPRKSEWFLSFFARIIGVLPGDVVSMYLGASGVRYRYYFSGSLLGLLPAIVSFSVMGMSADDPTSPAFIASAIIEVSLMLVSLLFFFLWHRKSRGKSTHKT